MGITIVTGYAIIARSGRVLHETTNVWTAFRIARRRNAIVERTDIHGEQTYMDANAIPVRQPDLILY